MGTIQCFGTSIRTPRPILITETVCPPAVCKFMLFGNVLLLKILLDTDISLIFMYFCYVFQSESVAVSLAAREGISYFITLLSLLHSIFN